MAVSKAQQKAVHKYVKANYDRMEITVPKGRRDEIKAFAEARGMSVNAFINSCIDEAMAVGNGAGGILTPETAQKAAQRDKEPDPQNDPQRVKQHRTE